LGLLSDGTATTALLVLLRIEPPKGGLAGPLWRRCFEPHLIAAATSRSAFVLLAMLKDGEGDGGVKPLVLGALRKRRKELEAAIKTAETGGAAVGGAKKLLEAAK